MRKLHLRAWSGSLALSVVWFVLAVLLPLHSAPTPPLPCTARVGVLDCWRRCRSFRRRTTYSSAQCRYRTASYRSGPTRSKNCSSSGQCWVSIRSKCARWSSTTTRWRCTCRRQPAIAQLRGATTRQTSVDEQHVSAAPACKCFAFRSFLFFQLSLPSSCKHLEQHTFRMYHTCSRHTWLC